MELLVGEDAQVIDEQVRQHRWNACEPEFVDRTAGAGHLLGPIG
jgi:hypothetical protein